MGAGGAAASAAVIEALKPLEAALPAGNLLNAMEDAVRRQVGVGTWPTPTPGPARR